MVEVFSSHVMVHVLDVSSHKQLKRRYKVQPWHYLLLIIQVGVRKSHKLGSMSILTQRKAINCRATVITDLLLGNFCRFTNHIIDRHFKLMRDPSRCGSFAILKKKSQVDECTRKRIEDFENVEFAFLKKEILFKVHSDSQVWRHILEATS